MVKKLRPWGPDSNPGAADEAGAVHWFGRRVMRRQGDTSSSRRWDRRGLAVLALVVLATGSGYGPADAATIVVAKDGTGDFEVIQDAVDAAAAGDTIFVKPGVYTESRGFQFDPGLFGETFVGVTTPNLTLIGAHRDSVIVGPEAQDWDEETFTPQGVSVPGDTPVGLTIQGMTIRNCREGLRLHGPSVVRDMTFFENGSHVVSSIGPVTIEDCEMIRGGQRSLGVFYVRDTENPLYARRIRTDTLSFGILVSDGATVIVEDSEFSAGGAYGSAQFGARLEVVNCVGTGSLNAGFGAETGSSLFVTDSDVSVRSQAIILEDQSTAYVLRSTLRTQFDVTVIASGESIPRVNWSNLLAGPQRFAVIIDIDEQPGDITTLDFRDNWWGTADPDSIAALIRDSEQDPRILYRVDFSGHKEDIVPTKSKSIGSLKSRFRN